MTTVRPTGISAIIVLSMPFLHACDNSIPERESLLADTSTDWTAAIATLTADSPTSVEGNAGTSLLRYSLTLSSPVSHDVAIDYVTMGSSATADTDFVYIKSSAVIAAGTTQTTIDIAVHGDLLDEDNEAVILRLASTSEITIATPQAVGTIIDDDARPSIEFGAASRVEGTGGVTKMLLPVTLSAASGRTVSVNYTTADGTATHPTDYQPVSGVLTFAVGETSKSVTFFIVGDSIEENDEFVSLMLQDPVNANLPVGAHSYTIVDDDSESGLFSRPQNLSCIAPDRPTVSAIVGSAGVYKDVGTFTRPLALNLAPGDSTHWHLAIKSGVIFRFQNVASPPGTSVFLDLSGIVESEPVEAGLLGMAFHPNYASNGYVFLSYTAPGPNQDFPLTSRLSRFQTLDGGLTLDPSTEAVLMSHDQSSTEHNGGHITFGPDGYLYWALGDDDPGGDPEFRAQNTKNVFGSLLRIDVDSGQPYGIPLDNPFVGNPLCSASTMTQDASESCPEIYAWGLRNPWRFSFDRATDDLWLADVGEHQFEEVNKIEAGGNYGWPIQEGFSCFDPPAGCDTTGLVQPLLQYGRDIGWSVTGGFVYRGTLIPELYGRYVFGDYVTGRVFATVADSQGNYSYEILFEGSSNISSFAEDHNGEIYYLTFPTSGTIRKLVQGGGSTSNTIPDLLSDTGCVNPEDPKVLDQALIPYDTNATFWSDGAEKSRYYAIPDGTTVDVDSEGDWHFPVGTILVKNFRLDDKLIETRHFMRHTDGDWAGYTYEWNEEETEATRVIGGKTRDINGQSWVYPSESQCMLCHTNATGRSLGAEHAQLNKSMLYPSTGITANQLYTADHIGMLTVPLPDVPDNLPALADPLDFDTLFNFDVLATSSYAGQDADSNVAVEDAGATIVLADNTWRKAVGNYDITPSTVLEFDFESDLEAEVQGIGFEENDAIDDSRVFRVFGSQSVSWTINDFNTYPGSGIMHFSIPVGQYYTGTGMSLVFVNDDDAGAGSNSRYSNIRIVNTPVNERARAYLHTNCAGCHRPSGPTPSDMDLRYDTPLANTNTCDIAPTSGTLGLADPRIIAPGDASRSVIVDRISRRDIHGMPPIASNMVDTNGVTLLTEWITAMSGCQ